MIDLKEVWDFIVHHKVFSAFFGTVLLGIISFFKRWITLHYRYKGELLQHEEAKIIAEKDIKIEKIRAKSLRNSRNDIPTLRIDRDSP